MAGENSPRGIIKNRAYAGQICLFKGLRWGTITPTDIDGFIDFGDKAFVFLEAKHRNEPLPRGQSLALERLCEAACSSGRAAVVLVASHNDTGDIDMANATVTTIYQAGRWKVPSAQRTVRATVDAFMRYAGVHEAPHDETAAATTGRAAISGPIRDDEIPT